MSEPPPDQRLLDDQSIVKRYDPDVPPPRKKWLELDEQERILLVQRYHERAKVDLPNAQIHAVMHTIVENQLAEAIPEVVAAFERLRREGLDRHDAIHAVGSVLARHVFELMKDGPRSSDPNAAYFAGLSELTAAQWHAD